MIDARGALVGRDALLNRLGGTLHEAALGRGALIVLTGEAGVGKTSIAEACATDGAARGFHVLSVANYHSARAPFGPFLEVMRMLARERPEAVPAAAGDRLVFERFIGTAPVAGSEQPLDKRRFFVVAAEVLERSAAVTPLLAIVEDAHWSDPESLEFLRFFAPRLATAPIVVIVTLRTDADDDALAVQIDALSRLPVTQRHTVTPLDDRSLLTIITLSAPNVSLDAENAAALCRRAEGNPLIALELARDAASGAPLPSSFVTAIGARLRNLQPSERTAIEAASVVGRTFAFSDLQALLNLPRTTLISAIRGARDAGIVEETAIGFAFRHERLREAVETRMLAVERSDLHRRRALALEALGGDAALLAMHWAAANEPARAAPFAERAGDEAMARDAFATARARYREALAGSDDDAAVRLEPKLARASESLGDAAGAARWYDAAAQRARAAGTDDGRWRLRAADSQYRAGHRDEAMAAVRLLLAETADASLQFDGAALLAMYHAYAGEAEFAEHFIGVARGYDGPRETRYALSLAWARAVTAILRDDDAWLEAANDAVAIAEASGDAGLIAINLVNYSGMALPRGRRHEARAALDRAIAFADRNGRSYAAAYGRCYLAEAQLLAGDLTGARASLLQVASFPIDASIVRTFAATVAVELSLYLGVEAAIPALSSTAIVDEAFATGEASRFAPLAAAHARLAARRGDPAAVADLIGRALPAVKAFAYASAALLAFCELGGNDEAAIVRGLLGPIPSVGVERVHHLLIEAVLAQKAGDTATARRRAIVAADAAERLDAPLLRAKALEYAGRGNEALAIYRAHHAEGEVRRLSGRRKGVFTRRESQVHELVLAGRTNRQIAEALVLSERTVENHVASILAKSGVRSRVELLSAAADTASAALRRG